MTHTVMVLLQKLFSGGGRRMLIELSISRKACTRRIDLGSKKFKTLNCDLSLILNQNCRSSSF